MDPALLAALEAPSVLGFVAIEIALPSYTIRLLDGAATVTLFGHTFTGRDDSYGTLHSVEAYSEAMDGSAPTLVLTLLPPTTAAVADLANPAAQGSPISCWAGAVDVATGLAIGTPEPVFFGELDVPTLTVARGSRTLQYACISVFELMFSDSEGALLSDAFHQSLFPGELGLEYQTDVQRDLPWGADAPRSPAIHDIQAEINAAAANFRG